MVAAGCFVARPAVRPIRGAKFAAAAPGHGQWMGWHMPYSKGRVIAISASLAWLRCLASFVGWLTAELLALDGRSSIHCLCSVRPSPIPSGACKRPRRHRASSR